MLHFAILTQTATISISDAQYVKHDISITLGMQKTTWLDKEY